MDEMRIKIQHLKHDCEKCFGLCCVALYFTKHDGFPTDKKAGTPCSHLKSDFRCDIHEKLETSGLKGCVSYECFGAGQYISQVTFAGQNWHADHSISQSMFDVFLIMRQLHEMCWFLTEASLQKQAISIREEIRDALDETEQVTKLSPYALRKYDISAHRAKINILLKHTSKLVRNKAIGYDINSGRKQKAVIDLFGKDLRKKDLRYMDLRGACLIAANLEGADLSGTDFIGADLRDTNLKGADLTKSIFLTQFQINAARGDLNTKLPLLLSRPKHWM